VRSAWTVSVVDYSPAGHRPQWLVTEYVAAPSLTDWVERYGPLPGPAVRALAAELGEGLRAVHRAGLAHRDVKPSDVLRARRHPLLIDFGIARATHVTRHTHTGGVVGSPGYMAPEQATGGISGEPADRHCGGRKLGWMGMVRSFHQS
jgi:serine/threonine protein kinase